MPKRALVYDNDQIFVYRADGDEPARRARLRRAALTDKFYVEPRGRPRARATSVVVAGQAGLKDGALVSCRARTSRDRRRKPPRTPRSVVREGQPVNEPTAIRTSFITTRPVAILMVFLAAVVFGWLSLGPAAGHADAGADLSRR